MSNAYFTDASTAADFTRARASSVNTLSAGVEAAFDLLPPPDVLEKVAKPAVVAGGTANALIITNADPVTGYGLGQKIAFKASQTNSAATTVNVDGVGVKNLLRPDGSNLVAADLTTGRMYEATFDGTSFQLHTNLLDLSVDGVGSYIAQISAAATAASASAAAASTSASAASTSASNASASATAAANSAATFTAASLLASIKTVDGSGSGLDADLVRNTAPGAAGLSLLATASVAAAQAALFGTQAAFPAGTNTAPGISPTGDTNTGIYFSAADTVDIATNGTNRLKISTTAITSTLPIYNQDGSLPTPSYTFASDTDTGMYSSGAGQISFGLNGQLALQLTTTRAFFGSTLYSSIGLPQSKTPATSGATGTQGDFAWDASYFYICIATNSWHRVAHATW
jgi:hypothetical protein